MSTTAARDLSRGNPIRVGFAISGAVSAIIGILILVWPGHTAVVVTAVIAAWAIIGGLVYIALGIFAHLGGWSRIGHIILGAFFVIGGILAFTRLGATTAALFLFVGILVGILWIVEGVAALGTLGGARFKVPTLIFALLSIIAGIVLLFSPLYSVVLWLWLGVALLVLGIVQLFRAITWGRGAARGTDA
ncbi:HdeD family acid-resistance protein [Gryllotalpicola reticulitermitis]|uniref:HdeD family acid-resistance protein n=1 Tax=Gryllotalpicola reticulitermitis TaxID=1184153 RepID=A0ABV8Q2H9_9MICO